MPPTGAGSRQCKACSTVDCSDVRSRSRSRFFACPRRRMGQPQLVSHQSHPGLLSAIRLEDECLIHVVSVLLVLNSAFSMPVRLKIRSPADSAVGVDSRGLAQVLFTSTGQHALPATKYFFKRVPCCHTN
ncbi:hypothetical protein F5B17DRAFT_434551 [Nemania serpens]|nr:hypothetical protein F5B17DRAFT_434551 [Nemania serpens]